MCSICNLLNKSFPKPKTLARAYIEVLGSGVLQGHPEEIEERMEEALQEQNLSEDEFNAYIAEYQKELDRLKG